MAEEFRAYSYWYERGVEYYIKMDYDAAIRCFSRSLQDCKNSGFDAWYMKGNSFYQLREYDEAINCFTKSISTSQIT